MAESELEKAFATLSTALTLSEEEVTEEIKLIEQQINELKERIVQLNGRQETLAHDRQSVADMLNRYLTDQATGSSA